MYPEIATLAKLLVAENYISEADSKAASEGARTSKDYVAHLLRNDKLTKELLGQAIAESYDLPFSDLNTNPVSKESIQSVPEEAARTLRVVIVNHHEDTLTLATDTPAELTADKLKKYFIDKLLNVTYTLPEYIDAAFTLYEQPLGTRFSKIIQEGSRVAPEIVDEILKDAAQFAASDVHFEPHTDEVIVRFRVDGELREAGRIPKTNYDNILNRIKIEGGMRIDEHNAAQDGAMQHTSGNITIDLRISLVPTVSGEKIVMRLLSSYVQELSLAKIGLDEVNRATIENAAAKPFGMILTVGPTGSGKTTTLYSLIRILDKPNVNITTIEDPVEFKLPSINQIQVQEQTNLTFAKGLRAIVRQDPDVILVGEIRDHETAQIAVNAALTGHLLLSTFHSNDAATTIPRLIDMGIEPFLLASTLQAIVAQRLVRQICSHCRYSVPAQTVIASLPRHQDILKTYFSKSDTLYSGKGCNLCGGTGYRGRIALFECISVTPEMQDLILTRPATQDIRKLAQTQGSISMFTDGLRKVKSGDTTISELLRVVEVPTKGAIK